MSANDREVKAKIQRRRTNPNITWEDERKLK